MASIVVSLVNVADWVKMCTPVVVEGALGVLDHDQCDGRLAAWAPRVLARAKVELDVHGAEHIDRSRAMVLMSNHASFYDIPVVYAVFGGKLRMVAKKELFRTPVIGKAMYESGMIEVDRGNRTQAIGSLDRGARALIDRGASVWIAPEGTRSTTGGLGPFKKGGFHLAMRLRLPILPMSLKGTHALLPPHALATRSGASVRVTVHPPVETGPYADDTDPKGALDRLMKVVRDAIESGL